VQNYGRQIKLKFKLLAIFFDLFDLPYHLNKKTNPRYALARKISNENLRILDVCVGTAIDSIAVGEAKDRNEIVGIDLSPEMISVAKGKIRKRGLRNISLNQMDAAKMSFQDSIFDIAMISFGLHELNYELMMDVLKEMHRVLKNGGKLYIVDYERQGGSVINFFLSIYLKIFEPKHITQFLKYDWNMILQYVGFQVNDVEKCFFSKLISATKHQKRLQYVQ